MVANLLGIEFDSVSCLGCHQWPTPLANASRNFYSVNQECGDTGAVNNQFCGAPLEVGNTCRRSAGQDRPAKWKTSMIFIPFAMIL